MVTVTVAKAAALLDKISRSELNDYSTTAQITAMLAGYVLKTLPVVGGLGVTVNAGLTTDLSGTLTISLDLSEKALAQSVWNAAVSTVEAPISPEKLKAAVEVLAPRGGYTDVDIITTTGPYTVPANLDTSVTPFVWVFGAGGGNTGGYGGLSAGLLTLTPGEVVSAVVGASTVSGASGSTTFKTMAATGGQGSSVNGVGSGGSIINARVSAMSMSQLSGHGNYLARCMLDLTTQKYHDAFRTSYPTGPISYLTAATAYNPLDAAQLNIMPGATGADAGKYGSAGAVFVFHRRKP